VLVAAAVCPHPPLLIPEATGAAGHPEHGLATGRPSAGRPAKERPSAGRPATERPSTQRSATAPPSVSLVDIEVTALREACAVAVSGMLAAGPDVVVVVGAAERSVAYPAAAAGSLRPYGVPFSTGTGEPVLPLALTVGVWLLRAAEADRVLLQGVWHALPASGCLELGARLAASAPRVGMLVMGDGPARRAAGPPGGADPAADAYDKELAAAFAAADADRLAALDASADAELMVAGRPAWQVLAGAARGRELRGQVLFTGAPLEVSYLVAAWQAAS
jgi:hypothetical protein